MMIKRFIIVITLLVAIVYPFDMQAQLENIYSADSIEKLLRQDKFEIDSTADAIILFRRRKATLHYARHNRAWEITEEVAIKVLSDQAKNLGQLSVPYIQGVPIKNIYFENYNILGGQLTKIESSKEDIIKEKINKKVNHAKFQIPNVTNGSIIYYTYTIKTPFFERYLGFAPISWDFGSDYPTIHSRFELNTRNDANFKGFCNFTTFTNVTLEDSLFTTSAGYYKQQKRRSQGYDEFIEKKEIYAKNNILPTVDEPFSIHKNTTNHILTFRDLSSHGSAANLDISWDTANIGMKNEIAKITNITDIQSDSLKAMLLEVVAEETDTLAVAQAIYRYVRDSISINETRYYTNLHEVAKTKKGSHGEKVLLAVWWLNAYGIKAISVITSADQELPLDPSRYNEEIPRKTILAAVVSGRVYYLDPNSKYPFGFVSPDFLSGFAWGITETGIPMELSRSELTSKNFYEIDLKPSDNDSFNFDMTVKFEFGELDAHLLRKNYKSDSTKVKESFIGSMEDLGYQVKKVETKFINSSILDSPFVVSANFQIKIPLNEDIEYFIPFLLGEFKENPFKSVYRINPIEFPSRLDYQYKISMKLPDDYAIDELPEPKSVNMLGNAITFNLKTSNDEKTFTLYNSLNINKCTFDQNQYSLIRKYFESVVEAQSRKITVRKHKR